MERRVLNRCKQMRIIKVQVADSVLIGTLVGFLKSMTQKMLCVEYYFYLVTVSLSHPFLRFLVFLNIGPKQVKSSGAATGANSSAEIQALSNEV